MRGLPPKAQAYLIIVYFLGLFSAGFVSTGNLPRMHGGGVELTSLLILAILAGNRKITLMRHFGNDDAGSMSLGIVITVAAMLRFGPVGAFLAGTVGCLSACLFPKIQPIHQLTFNVALTAVESLLSSMSFLLLNGWSLEITMPGSMLAIIGSSLVYFVVNTGGVATIIALCSKKSVFACWRETFFWTFPSYLVAGCVGAFSVDPVTIIGNFFGALILLMPAAILMYQSYSTHTAREEEKKQHIEEMEVSHQQLADLYLATIRSLAVAIGKNDPYTSEHVLRVQIYSVAIATEMGLSEPEVEGVRMGALLHDIGKIGVFSPILRKPSPLTAEEYANIKEHPEIGAAILDPVPFPWPVLPIVKYHHEKWDGSGYPDGLKREEIPLGARILAVADAYDALTSTRSYRNARTHEGAVAIIAKDAGKHFDPVVAKAFLNVIGNVVAEMAERGEGPLALQESQPDPVVAQDKVTLNLQRVSSEVWALYEIAQSVSAGMGSRDTLDILSRKVAAIFPDTTCVFFLPNETGDRLVACDAVGLNCDFFIGSETVSNACRTASVYRDKTSYLGEYDQTDLVLHVSQTNDWKPLRSALVMPMVHHDEVLGTFNLYRQSENAFTYPDIQLIEAIARRAALAIYNGLLFDRTRSDAQTDPLTGLYNLQYLTEHVEERCVQAERYGTSRNEPGGNNGANFVLRTVDTFSLLCLDLDSFKPLNDNFGHQRGDEVLRDIAGVFRKVIRDCDTLARYGGDEFIIVLDATGPKEASAMERRIQDAVEKYDPGLVHPRLGRLHIGVSIGHACFPVDGESWATLLSVADARMYGDKTERKLGRLAGANYANEKEGKGKSKKNGARDSLTRAA